MADGLISHRPADGRGRPPVITDEIANEIRRRWEAGETYEQLAVAFHVAERTVRIIVKGSDSSGSQTYNRFRDWPPAQRTAEVAGLVEKRRLEKLIANQGRPKEGGRLSPSRVADKKRRLEIIRNIMNQPLPDGVKPAPAGVHEALLRYRRRPMPVALAPVVIDDDPPKEEPKTKHSPAAQKALERLLRHCR